MNSEKIKEIKKALECCKENEDTNSLAYCHRCPFGGHVSCEQELYQKSVTLINELESENERLILQYERVKADSEMNCLELKDRIAELEEDKEKWQRKAIHYYRIAKSYGIECIVDNDIDETLKEFIDEPI